VRAPSVCLVAWLATRIAGCDVQLVDVDDRKRAAAQRLGIAFSAPGSRARDADVVVHASGSAAGSTTALESRRSRLRCSR
jgi:hypothetical protein